MLLGKARRNAAHARSSSGTSGDPRPLARPGRPEDAQLLDGACRLPGGRTKIGDDLRHLVVQRSLLQFRHCCEDDLECVVEIVGHRPGEATEQLQFLPLAVRGLASRQLRLLSGQGIEGACLLQGQGLRMAEEGRGSQDEDDAAQEEDRRRPEGHGRSRVVQLARPSRGGVHDVCRVEDRDETEDGREEDDGEDSPSPSHQDGREDGRRTEGGERVRREPLGHQRDRPGARERQQQVGDPEAVVAGREPGEPECSRRQDEKGDDDVVVALEGPPEGGHGQDDAPRPGAGSTGCSPASGASLRQPPRRGGPPIPPASRPCLDASACLRWTDGPEEVERIVDLMRPLPRRETKALQGASTSAKGT